MKTLKTEVVKVSADKMREYVKDHEKRKKEIWLEEVYQEMCTAAHSGKYSYAIRVENSEYVNLLTQTFLPLGYKLSTTSATANCVYIDWSGI